MNDALWLPENTLNRKSTKLDAEISGADEDEDYKEILKPLTAQEAFRVSAARDMIPARSVLETRNAQKLRANGAYLPPTSYTEWSMEEVAESSALYSAAFITTAATIFIVASTAFVALLILCGAIEMHSAKDIRVFAIVTFIMACVGAVLTVCVDAVQPLLPFGPRGPRTYRASTSSYASYALLAVLLIINLVRFFMIAHDVDDAGSGHLLRTSRDLGSMEDLRILDRYIACLWGAVYAWVIAAPALILNIFDRAYPERVADLSEIYAEVYHCGASLINCSVSRLITKAQTTTGATRSAAIALFFRCIRHIRPTSTTFWTASTLVSPSTAFELFIYGTFFIHAGVALLYATDAMEFDDRQEFYRFYFAPAILVVIPLIVVLFTQISPMVNKERGKFTRQYLLATLVPLALVIVIVGILGFRGKGIEEKMPVEDDDEENSLTSGYSAFFYDDDDLGALAVPAEHIFGSGNDGDVSAPRLIVYNEVFTLVDGYIYLSALLVYYFVISFAAHIRPTVTATYVTFDRNGIEQALDASAKWLWYNKDNTNDDNKRDSFIDPSMYEVYDKEKEENPTKKTIINTASKDGAVAAMSLVPSSNEPLWGGSILTAS